MKIFLSVLLLGVVLFGLNTTLDESAMILHEKAFDRAMVAFGLAKGLNAVISLIQGTELSFTPVGIGLNFSVGEILDPFNDMVERFSWVMLFASVSLGIQKLLLILSTKLFLQVALVFSMLISIGFVWMKKVNSYSIFTFSFKVLGILLILRFGAVFFVYSSEVFYNSVLQAEYHNSSKIIENTKSKLENIQNHNAKIVEVNKEAGIIDSFTDRYGKVLDSLDISKKLQALEVNIETASQNIITLITIFIAQSILMPLLFLWLLVSSVKWIVRVEIKDEKIVQLLNYQR